MLGRTKLVVKNIYRHLYTKNPLNDLWIKKEKKTNMNICVISPQSLESINNNGSFPVFLLYFSSSSSFIEYFVSYYYKFYLMLFFSLSIYHYPFICIHYIAYIYLFLVRQFYILPLLSRSNAQHK